MRRHPSACKRAGVGEEDAETEIDAAQGRAGVEESVLHLLLRL